MDKKINAEIWIRFIFVYWKEDYLSNISNISDENRKALQEMDLDLTMKKWAEEFIDDFLNDSQNVVPQLREFMNKKIKECFYCENAVPDLL